MNKIRKGDEVIVISGKDRNRRGTVLQIIDNERVLVEGINIAKKHVKPNPNLGIEGGILDREMPLDRRPHPGRRNGTGRPGRLPSPRPRADPRR